MATEHADSRRTRVRIVEASRRLFERRPRPPWLTWPPRRASRARRCTDISPTTRACGGRPRPRPRGMEKARRRPSPPGHSAATGRCRSKASTCSTWSAPQVLPDSLRRRSAADRRRAAGAVRATTSTARTCCEWRGRSACPCAVEAPLAMRPDYDSDGALSGWRPRSPTARGSKWCHCGCSGSDRALYSRSAVRRARPLAEIARQMAGAITLADRYTTPSPSPDAQATPCRDSSRPASAADLAHLRG